jgi:hypothetical protein
VQLDTINGDFDINISVSRMTDQIEVKFQGVIIVEDFKTLYCKGPHGGTVPSWKFDKTTKGETVFFECRMMDFRPVKHIVTRQMLIGYRTHNHSVTKVINFRIEVL